MTINIVVLGSANADYSMRTPRIPSAGETLQGSDFQFALGGKGANQAIASARLGGRVAFVACVGRDSAGELALATYRDAGIDVDAVSVVDAPTGSALIFVDDAGENCIGVAAGANEHLAQSHAEAASRRIANASHLLMQLETPIATIQAAAEIARDCGTQTILNPAPARPLPRELLALVDIVTPNQTELASLTDMRVTSQTETVEAARELQSRGPNTVIVTLGAAGALVVTDDTVIPVETSQVAAIDTTAAGDTFNGALTVALAQGETLIDAVHFANRAAALSVTRRGAIDAIPTRVEVDAFR
ncbi:MAG: ribokinase [Pseudomonadota bacterium]